MHSYALTAVGRDRPGIVAAISKVLLDHEINIEDSHMSILRGHFTMTLIVSLPEESDLDALNDELRVAGEQLDLELLTIARVDGLPDETGPAATHIVSVYGVDRPGIVHAVSSTLAEREITITDLQTRIFGDEAERLYSVMLEVLIPEGEVEETSSALASACATKGLEISVRPLEADAL